MAPLRSIFQRKVYWAPHISERLAQFIFLNFIILKCWAKFYMDKKLGLLFRGEIIH
jgi:hypothetical protein